MKILAALTLAAAALPCAAGLAEDYPGPWRTDAAPGITRTLARHGVAGCGQYAWRQRAGGGDEFLVYCTADGRTWMAWLAWPKIEKVMGPYPADPRLPIP